MKQLTKLEETIERLLNDPKEAITVVNLDNLKNIACDHDAAMFEQNYGGIAEFFNSLGDQGFKNLRIKPKRSNGSSWKAHEKIAQYDIQMGEPEAQVTTDQHRAAPQPAFAPQAPMPLLFPNGLSGAQQGLGYPEIHKIVDYPKIERELIEVKAENRVLLERNRELEKEVFKFEVNAGKTAATREAQTELMKTFGPMLAPVVEKMASAAIPVQNATSTGLAGGDLTPNQREAFTQIQSLNNNTVHLFNILLQNIENDAFGTELVALMEKHNLIPKT